MSASDRRGGRFFLDDCGMEHSFSINWGAVSECGEFPAGWELFALWPAPVNEDVCFTEAGYTHFQYEDEGWSESHWDAQAEILQRRVLDVLSTLGSPVLLSQPLLAQRSIWRFWKPGAVLPLVDQLRWPFLNDSLPEAEIRFGADALLRAGSGHELYWIGLRSDGAEKFSGLLAQIAAGWSVERVQLDWSKLGGGACSRFDEVA